MRAGVMAMHKVTRSAGIGIACRSALEIGVFVKIDNAAWDSRTVSRDGLTALVLVWSASVGEEAAEEVR
jgi:hypothetical protein